MGRPRRKPTSLFAGARGKAKDKSKLEGWVAQKKRDGQYVEFDLDCQGKIEQVRSKTGKVLTTEESEGMLGVQAGYPLSTLCGELMGHTEAGKRDARDRGYSRIYIFDALILDDKLILEEPYHVRIDLIRQMHAELGEVCGDDKPYHDDERARARDFHGRFTRRIPKSWKRTPIIQSYYTPAQTKKLWDEYVIRDGGEGIVFCDPKARLGKRASKLKWKPSSTLDGKVIRIGPRHVRVEYLDIANLEEGVPIEECPKRKFIVGCSPEYWHIQLGDMLEIGFERFKETTGDPTHPYVLKNRRDLL